MGIFKRRPPPPLPTEEKALPQDKANPLSKITFQWVNSILTTGFKRPLEKEDLYTLPDWRLSRNLTATFQEHWKRQLKRKTPNLFYALNQTFGLKFWYGGLCRLIADTLQITSPLVIQQILQFCQESYGSSNPPPIGTGIMWCIVLYVMQVASTIFMQQYFQLSAITGLMCRTVLISSIYQKSMVLSGKARMNFTMGKITNLMSTDTTRIDFICGYFHIIWAAPVEILIGLGLLIRNLGISGLAGFAIMIIMAPLQTKVMRMLSKLRRKAVLITDSRVKLTQEMLNGIKVIKFYGWEDSFSDQLHTLRSKELTYIRSLMVLRSVIMGVAMTIPVIASILSFITYSLTGHILEPSLIFSSLTIFNLVRMPLMFLPMVIGAFVDGQVSLNRIQEMFVADELEKLPEVNYDAKDAILIEDGDFVWQSAAPSHLTAEKDGKGGKGQSKAKSSGLKSKFKNLRKNDKSADDKDDNSDSTTVGVQDEKDQPKDSSEYEPAPFLRNINVCIPRGSLVAVVGAVGSGKSSFLNALVGEMKQTKGDVVFGGDVGYCPQTAWIQNNTVKNNILFGLPLDEARYQQVIKDCALEPDLQILPDGDATEIGERGINLSGGQKQRINLARATYYNADILLLDDPLSAVDAHVGKHLFEKCICTALAGKTRVLVTHQLHVLPKVDYILVMKDGEIAEEGTFTQLLENKNEFSVLMEEYGGVDHAEEEDVDEVTTSAIKSEGKKVTEETGPGVPSKALMTTEERNTGAVQAHIYKYWIDNAGGWLTVFVIVFFLCLMPTSNIGTNQWLSYWSSYDAPQGINQAPPTDYRTGYFMGVYAALGVAQAICNFMVSFCFSIAGVAAAKSLHGHAVKSIFRAPMSFFDTTPIGRIMNRFSKDIDAIDNLLADSMRQFFGTLIQAVGTFVLISVYFPVFLAPLFVLLVLYYFAAIYYRSTSRELKRLDSILRSTIYAHFGESLSGLATIRAYREQTRFIKNNQDYTDLENRAYYLSITIQRWLAVRLETIANTMILFVTIFSVVYRMTLNPSTMGFVLSYSLSLTGTFNWTVRQWAEMENNFNSVERLWFYTKDIDQEAPARLDDAKPPSDWPTKGDISMRNVVFRYRKGLPAVLHNLSLDIKGGEKIGVVGRTGSGKSTIMIALFRLVELAEGQIFIDDVDISKMGLYDLRTRLAIIPQDPVLFHGTIRLNLDPFQKHTDQELWSALERSDLKHYISTCSGGLDADVSEGGENLSVGQRQLLCLARAMLTKARIIVMDEATASVDVKTDAFLQKALRIDFKNCTLLTIAHRLNTIIDYDRVLVLDNGVIKELDSPHNLLSDPNSAFSSMIDETGPSNSVLLRRLAKDAQEGRFNIEDLDQLVAQEQEQDIEEGFTVKDDTKPKRKN
ncbi:P-loop containing nucleoside triphosphate hydrolase protein [Umbelopsis sp. AD052]|nr:P-loop containing nucleoside triphosphate hydrolase protein [Umbelopsis sp. AD052]